MSTKTGMVWEADLQGEDGNAWVIMGVTSRIIRQTLGEEEAKRYGKRARSGDYENLLKVTREYVTIRDMPSGYWSEESEAEALDEVEIDKTAAMGVALTTLINSLQGKEKEDLLEVLRSTLESGGDTDTRG